ncbi:neural cell adhesion molecule 2-like [Saccostrea cucullata]|uniref:neural cell adhesion molecule 2-like n=1 Tax=Saccostrea cuccullata TaxID=36930 RepID=UPI002ED46A19
MISNTYLQVNESSKGISPEAVYQRGDKVFVGENATLVCIFSGNPVPKIAWRNKNGTYIHVTTNDKYMVGQYGRRLQIINVTFADEGVYECKTNSNLIQNPFLNVTSPPLFPDVGKRFMTKILQNSTTVSIVLQCNAMSATAEVDPIVIKWMKNGEILNEDVRKQLSGDKTTLHIYNIISDDYGCYTCVIENSEGIAVANFLLPYEDFHLCMIGNHQFRENLPTAKSNDSTVHSNRNFHELNREDTSNGFTSKYNILGFKMESLVISLIFLCVRDRTLFCKGAERINSPPIITSEFNPEYFVPIFHSTPLSLFCEGKNNVHRYQWYKNYSKIVENGRVSCNSSTG